MNLTRFLHHMLDILLPTACVSCGSSVGDSPAPYFCRSCWEDFSLLRGPVCPRCGRLFDSPEALSHSPGHLCLSCRQDLPHFDQSLSVGYFEGTLREAIHAFKYRPCRALGRPLARWMSANILLKPGIDLVMPVPLHTKRLRQRGFNQSLLLAYGISRAYGQDLSFDNLQRVRFTTPQVRLSGAERIANVSGAFRLRRPGEVAGRPVLLVDDVYTTGATVNECARVLKEAGADRVLVLTLARAV